MRFKLHDPKMFHHRAEAAEQPIMGLHHALTRTRDWAEYVFYYLLAPYLALCVYLYFAYVQPWIAGLIDTRIGADSDRYWDAVISAQTHGLSDLVSFTGNYLGPAVLGLLLHTGFWVMCVNIAMFFCALWAAASIPGVRLSTFGLLMLANLELIPALTTLNKEILVLLASVLTAKYLLDDRRPLLLLAGLMALSFFARWESVLLLVMSLLLMRLFPKRRALSLILLILLIGLIYPFAFKIIGVSPDSFDYLLEGANTILTLDKIQNAFGFPLVVAPKILMYMGGPTVSPSFYFANTGVQDHWQDPQQEIFQPFGCIAILLVLFWTWRTGRLRLSNPAIYFVALTLVITAASPFIQPRYLYGAYVVLCLEVARPKPAAPAMGLRQRVVQRLIGPGRSKQALPARTTAG